MTRVAGRRGGFPLLTTAFVSTLVPVLHAEIPVLCLPSHPMWPIVAGCRQITGLDPSCRRPILLFVALPFFSFTPHPLHTPLHTPSSSLVFVIDHPPLVHLSFPPLSLSLLLPPTLNTTGCRWQRLKANRIFINTTGLQTHSLSTPEVLIVPTVFNSNPHKGDGMTLLAYRVRARVCACVSRVFTDGRLRKGLRTYDTLEPGFSPTCAPG